jgi:hypothetical protein
MKYGKEFQHILDASDFPDDWKTSAIEYRKVSARSPVPRCPANPSSRS